MTRVGGGARLALVAVMALSAAACGASATPSAASSGSSLPPVVRAVLAAGNPAAAAGQDLELARYTIQPGTTLALHRHPGMQLAWIESGVLTYTVEVGKVTVHRVDGSTIDVRPGDTVRIVAGEWLAETESVVHFGANEGPDVVVILAASLLQTGQSPAIPMPSPS
jgi:quercetin dioxygenase-like cupin family protein